MKKDRYTLVCQGDIILDNFRHETRTGKDGYDLMNHNRIGGDVPDDLYSKEELVKQLNEYDRQVNSAFYDNPEQLLSFEEQVFPVLQSQITQAINDLDLYESMKGSVAYNDLNYNTGGMGQYIIDYTVKHADEKGYCPEAAAYKKETDPYTLTKVLLELEKYINEVEWSDKEKLVLYGLRARLMTLEG